MNQAPTQKEPSVLVVTFIVGVSLLTAVSTYMMYDQPPPDPKQLAYDRAQELDMQEFHAWSSELRRFVPDAAISVSTHDLHVDALTPRNAMAVAKLPFWPSAVGRALRYAEVTGRKPGIVILALSRQKPVLGSPSLQALTDVCAKHNIDLAVLSIAVTPGNPPVSAFTPVHGELRMP